MRNALGQFVAGVRTTTEERRRTLLARSHPDENGCWIWRGATFGKGYGLFNIDGRNCTAHRAAYRLFVGDIPRGLWVLHRCDVPACVNPQHLFLGSPRDNVQDMLTKGRCRPKRYISDQVVEAIRNAEGSAYMIAKQFGVSGAYVRKVRAGKLRVPNPSWGIKGQP